MKTLQRFGGAGRGIEAGSRRNESLTTLRLARSLLAAHPYTVACPFLMNAFLRTIGYRASESDRLVLSLVSIFLSVVLISVLVVVVTLWWNPQAKRDAAGLDAVLSGYSFDRVEIYSSSSTNVMSEIEAQKFVASLHRTNRIAHRDSTKQQVEPLGLISGSNVFWLSRGDDGTFSFGEYEFRLRQ